MYESLLIYNVIASQGRTALELHSIYHDSHLAMFRTEECSSVVQLCHGQRAGVKPVLW